MCIRDRYTGRAGNMGDRAGNFAVQNSDLLFSVGSRLSTVSYTHLLAADGQMMGYIHEGFWSCMDTLRDKNRLEALWESGKAPWKTWKD